MNVARVGSDQARSEWVPFVKICGLTNLEDALAAVESGATALGFNFYPRSPRFVEPAAVANWISSIPRSVWRVGVFVNEPSGRVAEIAAMLSLDVAQLHGDESPSDAPSGMRVWKAHRASEDGSFPALSSGMRTSAGAFPAEAFLLDGPSGEAFGGTGRSFDWSQTDWSRVAQLPGKIIIAGGLDEFNVQAAITASHPWGVDVCSAVEQSPGRKDHGKIRRFVEAARNAHGSTAMRAVLI